MLFMRLSQRRSLGYLLLQFKSEKSLKVEAESGRESRKSKNGSDLMDDFW
jgi:hypothetical protein